jgi:hypothetical protein
MTAFPEWLKFAADDGRGGAALRAPSIARGFDRSFVYNFSDHPDYGDWTDGTFEAVLKAAPDAPDPALATFTASTGTPSGLVTPVTFTLNAAGQSALPDDTDGDGATELLLQIVYTPMGGVANVIVHTHIYIVGAL